MFKSCFEVIFYQKWLCLGFFRQNILITCSEYVSITISEQTSTDIFQEVKCWKTPAFPTSIVLLWKKPMLEWKHISYQASKCSSGSLGGFTVIWDGDSLVEESSTQTERVSHRKKRSRVSEVVCSSDFLTLVKCSQEEVRAEKWCLQSFWPKAAPL